jgi:hypothetical protein
MATIALLSLALLSQEVDGGIVRTTTGSDGAVSVIAPGGGVLVDKWSPTREGCLETVIEPADAGFDVVCTIRNASGADPMLLDELPVPAFRLGPTVAAYDFEGSGWPELLSSPNDRLQSTYPNEIYAPVAVLRTADVAVGVSVLYPILEYRHDLSLSIEATGRTDWRVRICASRPKVRGDVWWENECRVPPGAAWSWRICVRFTTRSERWEDTLRPYVDWYRRRYGLPDYKRDSRPVRGFAFASPAEQTNLNPEGWASSIGRPDRDGLGKAASVVQDLAKRWPRVVVWAPTGLASRHKELNYPHQFASRWSAPGPETPNALRTAPRLFRELAVPHEHSWGLWWGRSAQQTPGFDVLPESRVDPNSPPSIAAQLRELRCATDTGATIIGLDAFAHSHNPIWNLIPLLQQMRASAPTVTFCTEGRACDVLHRLAPTWLDAYRTKPFRSGGHERIKGRHLLADLLNPGHETWAGMVFDRSSDPKLFGPQPDQAELRGTVRRIMELGYVPVLFSDIEIMSSTEPHR